MKKMLKRTLLTAAIFCIPIILYLLIQLISERPYGKRIYTPNQKFYVEKSTIFSYRGFIPTMPGSGSDFIVGYLKLYYHDGTLIDKYFQDDIGMTEPKIHNDSIYLLGEHDLNWNLVEIESKLQK